MYAVSEIKTAWKTKLIIHYHYFKIDNSNESFYEWMNYM